MRHFNNILYVSKGVEDETNGLKQALSLSRNNDAKLKIMVVAPELPKGMKDYADKYEAALINDMRKAVLHTAKDINLAESDLNFSIELDTDKAPATRIIQCVLEHGHDLVIKESQLRDGKVGMKSIDMSLLRKCPCPVWLCRPIDEPRADMRIAIAVDPHADEQAAHDLSKRMLELARSLADTCSGDLHILSCWDYEFESHLRDSPWISVEESDIQASVEEAKSSHKDALHNLIDASGIQNETNIIHIIRGSADEQIPTFVEDKGIDILVMGTVARTGIPGFIIGNTAENIVQKVPSSLMALKPHGFVSPVKAYK